MIRNSHIHIVFQVTLKSWSSDVIIHMSKPNSTSDVLSDGTLKQQPYTGIIYVFRILHCTFKMNTHLMSERPNPDKAPYRPAIVSVTQYAKMKPIQLKISATEIKKSAVKWMSLRKGAGGGVVVRDSEDLWQHNTQMKKQHKRMHSWCMCLNFSNFKVILNTVPNCICSKTYLHTRPWKFLHSYCCTFFKFSVELSHVVWKRLIKHWTMHPTDPSKIKKIQIAFQGMWGILLCRVLHRIPVSKRY